MPDKKNHSGHVYILDKARHYCACQERCIHDVEMKMKQWKVRPAVAAGVIKKLEKENFLNEECFARAFAGGKFRINKWGRNKIVVALRAKKISEAAIQKALEEIDEHEYLMVLRKLIAEKREKLSEPESIVSKNKVYKFALSRGFEKNLILQHLNQTKLI
jgi:regulatory protein